MTRQLLEWTDACSDVPRYVERMGSHDLQPAQEDFRILKASPTKENLVRWLTAATIGRRPAAAPPQQANAGVDLSD